MNYIHKFENYLVENLDLKNPELKETRRGFGDALVALGKSNPDVVVLGGDVSGSVRTDMFRDAFPDRFFSVGSRAGYDGNCCWFGCCWQDPVCFYLW